jgi:hypothetical protein
MYPQSNDPTQCGIDTIMARASDMAAEPSHNYGGFREFCA